MSTNNQKSPHVLIVGAGLGGLALAQCLRKQGITYEIYERETGLDVRTQGWAISVHTMLQGLKNALPADLPSIDVTNHLSPLDVPAQISFFAGGKKFCVTSSEDFPILRANRLKLRSFLATNIDIKFGSHPFKITEDASGVELEFANGTTTRGDVLVGADGVSSFVREQLLSDLSPRRVPAGSIQGEVILNKEQYKRQMHLAHSSYVSIGEGFHLFVGLKGILEDDESADYYWFMNWLDHDAEEGKLWTESASAEALFQFALDKSSALHPSHTEIIRLTGAEGIKSPAIIFKDLEIDHIPGKRITLLGDAAHPMTPFKYIQSIRTTPTNVSSVRGEGGSNAMMDALYLGKALSSCTVDSLQQTLADYEAEMLPRGARAVRASRNVLTNTEEQSMRVWGRDLQEEEQ